MSEDKTTAHWIEDHHTNQMYRDWITDIHDADSLPPEILALRTQGPWAVEVREVNLGDPSARLSMPDGSSATIGISLRQLRERFGGDEGYLNEPATGRVHVSLAEWKNRDPDTTFLHIKLTRRRAR